MVPAPEDVINLNFEAHTPNINIMGRWFLEQVVTKARIEIIGSKFMVGRDRKANLTTAYKSVSREHAYIWTTSEGVLFLQDNKSSNGCYKNGKRIAQMVLVPIYADDIIAFGVYPEPDEASLAFRVVDAQNGGTIRKSPDTSTPQNDEVVIIEDEDEVIVKKEKIVPDYQVPSTSRAPSKTAFLEEDDVIYIKDDDEDEDDFTAHSQILALGQRIKQEKIVPNEANHQEEWMKNIKMELELLDYMEDNVVNAVPLDVDDYFSQTCELEKALMDEPASKAKESPPKHKKKAHKGKRSKNNSRKKEVNSHKDASPKDSPKSNSDKVDSTSNTPPHTTNSCPSTSHRPAVDDAIAHCKNSKYSKPPIIEPHSMPSRRSSKPDLTNKRRHLEKINHTPSKKSCAEQPSSSTGSPSASENLRKIQETSKSKEQPKEKTRTRPKVKVSDNRGLFLTQPLKPTSPTSSNIPATPLKSLPMDLNLPDIEVPILLPPLEDNLSNPPLVLPIQPPMKQDCVPVNDTIRRIVQWSPRWIEERKVILNKSPPVNKPAATRMLRTFQSPSVYTNNILPLLMLELWEVIAASVIYDHDPFRATIVNTRFGEDCIEMDLEYMADNSILDSGQIPRPNNVCLVELCLRDQNKGRLVKNQFGVVTKFSKELVFGINPSKPQGKIILTVVVKTWSPLYVNGPIAMVKVLCNIGHFMHHISTLKNIKFCPLAHMILNPKVEDYEVSLSGDNRFYLPNVRLSETQKRIVQEACQVCLQEKPGMLLVQGPPATGKSTIIANTLLQLSLNPTRKPRVLLLAPSSAAVDVLVTKFSKLRKTLPEQQRRCAKLVRLGPDSTIGKDVKSSSLKSLALGYVKSKFSPFLQDKSVDLEKALKAQLGGRFVPEMKAAELEVLRGSNILATTLNMALSNLIKRETEKYHFSSCIIDEATQATELECLLPTQLNIERIIMFGDPKQLPTTVRNVDAKHLGFRRSFFNRVAETFEDYTQNPIRLLKEQYRMHEEICRFPSKMFYDGLLLTPRFSRSHLTPRINPYLLFSFINEDFNNQSTSNLSEAIFVRELFGIIVQIIDTNCPFSVGIITPFTSQKESILAQTKNIRFGKNVKLNVNTVDQCQGIEFDIVIISCVSGSPNVLLDSEERLNLALTRAKHALYIVGHYNLYKNNTRLNDIRLDAKLRQRCLEVGQTTMKFLDHVKACLLNPNPN